MLPVVLATERPIMLARRLPALIGFAVLSSLVVVLIHANVPAVQQGSYLQNCNGITNYFWYPGTTVVGTGSTATEANDDAHHDAADYVRDQLPKCKFCPDNRRCTSSIGYDWHDYETGDPQQDPITGEWSCEVSFSGVDVSQNCYPCP
jgi:hypothetical protein